MESNQSNAAALRAFRVLDYVAQQSDGCAAVSIVEALALPKQTVHRIVTQLQMAGLLIREPGSRRVQLGARITRFAANALMHGHANRERHAILSGLVADIGETCNLTALAAPTSCISTASRLPAAAVMLAPGSHVPLHATASGKLLLSLLPRAQRDRLLSVLPLRPLTTDTIIDVRALGRELDDTRKRRVGINRNEHLSGLIAVAVPVMVDRSRACAAIAAQRRWGA